MRRHGITAKSALTEAMLKFLAEKPIEKIKVAELCREADINRTSFYNLYLDVFDMLEKMEDEFYDELHGFLLHEATVENGTAVSSYKMIFHALETISRNREFCKILLAGRSNRFLTRLFQECMNFVGCGEKRDEGGGHGSGQECDPRHRLSYEFMLEGCIGLARYWIEHGCSEPIEEVCETMNQMVFAISGVIDTEKSG